MAITLEQAIAAEEVMSLMERAKYDDYVQAEWSKREYIYALNVLFLETPDNIYVEVKLSNGRTSIFGMSERFFNNMSFLSMRPKEEYFKYWYISPTGLAIIWPALQRVVYVPSLLAGEGEGDRCPWVVSLPDGKHFSTLRITASWMMRSVDSSADQPEEAVTASSRRIRMTTRKAA